MKKLIPLVLVVAFLFAVPHVVASNSINPLNCEPSVTNQYPANATAGERIVIVTTVTSGCVGPDVVVSRVIVNILPQNSSEILSTDAAIPSAVNFVTAPTRAGPWSLVVQVFWSGYPASGNFEEYQTTIVIKIK